MQTRADEPISHADAIKAAVSLNEGWKTIRAFVESPEFIDEIAVIETFLTGVGADFFLEDIPSPKHELVGFAHGHLLFEHYSGGYDNRVHFDIAWLTDPDAKRQQAEDEVDRMLLARAVEKADKDDTDKARRRADYEALKAEFEG